MVDIPKFNIHMRGDISLVPFSLFSPPPIPSPLVDIDYWFGWLGGSGVGGMGGLVGMMMV